MSGVRDLSGPPGSYAGVRARCAEEIPGKNQRQFVSYFVTSSAQQKISHCFLC